MALIETHFYSGTLGMQTTANVIIPIHSDKLTEDEFPVLYLLHGMSQNYSAWQRYSMVEQYAEEAGVAVVMPDAGMSWYTDMKYGFAYETFLTEELPAIISRFFPRLSRRREKTFVAGLSMGAYGALKFGMLHPDLFSFVGSFSPAPDIADHMNCPDYPAWEKNLYHDIFGSEEDYHQSKNDLFAQAPLRAHDAEQTAFYICCGTEDRFLPQTRSIVRVMEQSAYHLTYRESPGNHDWHFWNRAIRDFISCLPLKGGI